MRSGRATRWFDRGFAGAEITLACGPLATPDVADIRRVLAEVLRAAPDGPVALEVVDGAARRREHLDPEALAEAMVVSAEPLTPTVAVADALAARCADQSSVPDGLAFRMLVGPDHVVLTIQHVVGDASVANAALSGILRAAGGGELPSALITPTSRKVTTSVVRVLLRSLRPMPRCRTVAAPTDPDRPWLPVLGVAHVSFPEEVLRDFKAEARRLGVRRTSLLVAYVEQALAREGVAPVDDVRTLVVDCRRYLSAGQVVRNNFSSGMALRASWHEPADVDAVTTRALDRARPLLHLVAGSLPRWRPAPPVHAIALGAPVRLRPDYSVVGPLRAAAGLPWTGRPNFVSAVRPYRPDVVGVISCEVGQVLQVSLAYDSGSIDRAVVERVLRNLGTIMVDAQIAEAGPAGRVGEP